MFGIGGFELFIILIFGFLIFGPDKLPDVAKTIGKGIAKFKQAQEEMNETLGNEKFFDPNNPDEPFKNPVEVLDKVAARQQEKQKAKESGDKESKNESSESDSKEAQKPESSEASKDSSESSQNESAGHESFTERKARYERERAERQAKDQDDSSTQEKPAAKDGE